MIKIFLTVFLFAIIFQAKAQHNFTIDGEINNKFNGQKVSLSYLDRKHRIVDTVVVDGGKFTFRGLIDFPVKASVSIYQGGSQLFFIDKTGIKIKGDDLTNAQITGGKNQEDLMALKGLLLPLENQMRPLSIKMREFLAKKDTLGRDQLFQMLKVLRLKMNRIQDDFIVTHPNSYVSLDRVATLSYVIDALKFDTLYNRLGNEIKNTMLGKELAARLIVAKSVGVGKNALNFTQNDSRGNKVSLSDFKGKYILLDFWASWCGPCRFKNKNLVKTYQKLKDKNFEIIGISLDSDKLAWNNAIAKDGLSWVQISDLKGVNNHVAQLYDISAIPQNFLINPKGLIVAKNIDDNTLEKYLLKAVEQ